MASADPSPERERLRAWSQQMHTVHQRLSDALDVARESAEDAIASAIGPSDPAADPVLHCWGFCLALSGHHHSEDEVLFPHLAAAHPQLQPVLAQLRSDHSMIEHLLGEYRAALAQQRPGADLVRILDGISAVMTTHFRYEEKSLLPLLDALDLPDDPQQVLGPLADPP